MTDVVTYDVVPRAGVIDLGKQVEGLVTRVVLPNIRRGAGTVQLVHQRSDDQKPYPVPVTEDGDKVYWIVTRSDTTFPGRGQAELQWLGENGAVAKSITYQTNTTRSMAEPGPEPDEPLKPYTQAVARDAQAAKDAAEAAKEATQIAKASAGQAETAANTAQGAAAAAENIQQSVGALASQVRGDADKVTTDKAEAQKAAGDALESQQEAGRQATTAQEAATSARTAADRATESKGQAETARVGAEAAKAKAEEAAREAQKVMETAVLYTEQNLTDSQQEQARTNINAADKARQNILVGTETGNPISVDDAFSAPLCGLTVYGKSTQDGTPSPDNPVPIVNTGDGGTIVITISDKHEKTQTITIPTPNGLLGIPVAADGNYVDGTGQHWVCDEVDFTNGIRIKRVSSFAVTASMVRSLSSNLADYCAIVTPPPDFKSIFTNERIVLMSNRFRFEKNTKNEGVLFGYRDIIRLYFDPSKIRTLADAKEFVTANHTNIAYETVDPIQTPLTPAEIAAYKALITYAPDTVVQVSDGAGVKLDYQRDVNIAIKKLEDAIASMTTT